ncbi:hypothetical protein H4582DRAFT_1792798, partial [Lactarius indigo]
QETERQLCAAAAHCTVAKREIANLSEQLANKKKQPTKSSKVSARYITIPHLEAQHNAEKAQRAKKAQEEAERQARKQAVEEGRAAQIEEDIKNKSFGLPLSSYSRRADLLAIAGALHLSQEGTCAKLRKAIKEHLKVTPALTQVPRFMGLFGGKR